MNQTLEITSLMDLIGAIEGENKVTPLGIGEVIFDAAHETDKIFITVSGSGDIVIVRKNPSPAPIPFVKVVADISVTIIDFEHLSRIVPLVYEKVYLPYRRK